MAQIPEQIRPYVAPLARHHFWILAAIVPLVLLPLLSQGTAKIETEIVSRRRDIDDRIAALRRVQGITEHPNEAWSKAIEEQTGKIRKETLAEWNRFWEDQEPLRAWPARLGDDFLRAVGGLKPGGSLERPLLLRYQNTVPDLVRELPKRMGAADLMGEQGPAGLAPRGRRPGPEGLPGGPVGPRPGAAAAASGGLVEWQAEDQSRVFKSFKWEKAPSTTQVVLAQEELWIYGLFCDAIKRANTGAAGAFDAPIVMVERLSVGFPAAEERPGGEGTARIVMHAPPPPPAGGGEMPGGMGLPPGGPEAGMPTAPGAAAASRPFHPRFGGDGPAGGPQMAPAPGPEGEGAPPPSPDEALRQWIYVDFDGKPLTAAELASVPAAKMVHLMPFVLRVVMDERRLDGLLADLASAPVPIDVRQVRINVADDTPGGPRSMPGPGGAGIDSWPSVGRPAGSRPMDILVELRGTVGLAPAPDEKAIDGSAAAKVEGGGA